MCVAGLCWGISAYPSGQIEDIDLPRAKQRARIPEREGPTPAPCLSFPALCQTRSWETLNGSFQAFVFWQLCFCFLCPSLSPSLSGYSVGSAPVFTLRGSAVLPLLPTPRSPVPER